MLLLQDSSTAPAGSMKVEQATEPSSPVAADSESEKIQTSLPRVEGLPGDLRHLLQKIGWEFVGAIMETPAVAIGRSVLLNCDLWPRPLHPAFAWAMCYERESHAEGVFDQIVQPLRDEADRKLLHLEHTKAAIEDQLKRVLEEKAHNSDGYLLPNPGKEARLAAEEARLKALGCTVLIADNPKRGGLDLMVHKNGGAGLLVCYTAEGFAREWASLKRSPRNFEIISCALQGKTPPPALINVRRSGLIECCRHCGTSLHCCAWAM